MIRPSSKENAARGLLLVTGDFLIAWGALALAVYVRRTVPLVFTRSLLPPEKLAVDALTVFLFAGSFLAALALSGFYRRQVMPRERPMILLALGIQVALLTTADVFLQRPLPRTVLLGVLAMELLALPAWRFLLRKALPIRPRETILVGEPEQVRAAMTGLAAAPDVRIRVVGWVIPSVVEAVIPSVVEGPGREGHDQRATTRAPGPSTTLGMTGATYLGDLPEATERLRNVEEVIYVCPDASPQDRLALLRIRGPRGYLLLASHADALLTSSRLGWVGDQPLIEIAVRCGYGFRAAVKRVIDAVVGAVLAIVAAPVGLAVAAAIWLDDRGPVFIRQLRVGRGGVPFAMWKFRSMRDGEHVTRVGALLRRYRIDELPQLLNVIAGDMSLVGPRPERPEIVARILSELPEFELRSLVRPGLAGLAQVSAKYDSRPEVKLRYDLTYMCDWSLVLDIRLLLSSVSASLSGSGR